MSNKEQKLRNNLYKALTEYLIPDSKNASDLLKYGRETFLDQLAQNIKRLRKNAIKLMKKYRTLI